MKIRSKNVFYLENLCTTMEERMVKNLFNEILNIEKLKILKKENG